MTTNHINDRELSCFFVRELLPLYLEKHLDTARAEQIDHHLQTCTECQAQFIKTKKARQILEELSHTQAQASLVEYLKKEHHFWIDFFERVGWRQWPSTLQWAVELSGVALALVVVIHWFPWLNFAKQVRSMRAAQVAAINKPATQLQPTTVASDDVSAQGDEEPRPFNAAAVKPSPKKPSPKSVDAEAEAETEDENTRVASGDKTMVPAPTEATQNDNQNETNAGTTTVVDEEASNDAQSEAADGKKTGYVWRGTLKVEELTDDLAEKVTRVVSELGGVKAGQVELGWHRGGERYYHFILPEENYEKLLSALNGEGILTLNREVHPRVIKEGHMRIIMTLEEDK